MRPKKLILLVDDDEALLAQRRFLLETRGYGVTAVDGESAVNSFRGERPALVLIDHTLAAFDANQLVRVLKEIDISVPMMVASTVSENWTHFLHADAFLPKGTATADLLHRLKILILRKRGRKKQASAARTATGQMRR